MDLAFGRSAFAKDAPEIELVEEIAFHKVHGLLLLWLIVLPTRSSCVQRAPIPLQGHTAAQQGDLFNFVGSLKHLMGPGQRCLHRSWH